MNGNVFYMDWEVSLIEWMQKNLGDAGIAVSKVITTIGGETIAMLVLIVVLFCYSKEAGKRVGLTLLAANAWYPMIKNVVLRLRPYMVHENISVHQLVEANASPTDVLTQGYSFPSGHSASAASMYGIQLGLSRIAESGTRVIPTSAARRNGSTGSRPIPESARTAQA